MEPYPHIQVSIVADSVCGHHRLTTFVLTYPRYIHAELMTHRVFSRNAQSSRAIPTPKRILKVRENPVVPIRFGANQKGMQAKDEDVEDVEGCRELWLASARSASNFAEALHVKGLHKQWVNRVLEPYDTITTIVTSTEWENFWSLRIDKDAQPEINYLAFHMLQAYTESTVCKLRPGQWHLPFIDQRTKDLACWSDADGSLDDLLCKISSARCARVSYLSHEGTEKSVEEEVAFADRLISDGHMSPLEHPSLAIGAPAMIANFNGWCSYRRMIPGESVKRGKKA